MVIASAVAGAYRASRRWLAASSAQVEAPPAELGGHGGGEVADRAQLGEVLVEVGVGPVELAGAGPEPLQHLGGELGGPVVRVSLLLLLVAMVASWARPWRTALSSRSHRLPRRWERMRARWERSRRQLTT